jgi:creatinine amidohydrolase
MRVNHLLPTETAMDAQARGAAHVILPVGSFEQHGQHLPLATDTVVAGAIARELGRAYPVFILPPVTISCSHEHHAWPTTVSVSARTLTLIVDDVYESLARSGFSSLTIVSGHGGNYVLANIVQEGNVQGRNMALFPARDDWKDARRSAGLATSDHEDMHAGELETSILLHVNPELVRDGYQSADWTADDRRHLLTSGMRKYTTSGVIGRPSLASADKGKAVLHFLTGNFASVLSLFQQP